MSKSQIANRKSRLFIVHCSLFIVLLLALFLRLYRLDQIPPGVTHDEADTGYFAAAVYRGARSPVEAPYGYAYQPFTMVSGALFMALFGPSDLALRVHSAFWGTLLVLFTYLWARRAFGRAVGLGGAALVAVSFWTVCDSRFALNSAPAPALFTGAAWLLWRTLDINHKEHKGHKERRVGVLRVLCGSTLWGWVGFALLLAASFYVYEAALAASAAVVLLFVYLALFDRAHFRRCWLWFAGALVVVGALAAPHLLDPGSWGRTNTLSGPLVAASHGDWGPLATNVASTLGTFSVSGDSLVTYNLPGRPIFDPLASVFFYGGILLCLWRWRRPAYAFALMWLAMGIVPSLALGEWTSTLHSKAAEAPIFTLPALAAVEAGHWIAARWGRRSVTAFAAGCAVWLVVVAASTGTDYFVRWGESRDTRAAYFHNLTAICGYLNDADTGSAVAFSSPFPDLPLDPLIADMRIHRDDLALRWFDARRAVVFPAAERSLLIVPPNTPLDPAFADRLDLRLIERVQLRPDDVDPYFDVFEWQPQAALARFLAATGATDPALPVNFSAVELVAYELATPTVAPGGEVALVTVWRILDPATLPQPPQDYGRAAVIFVHALDAGNNAVSQEDRLDAPAWAWRSGDAFVQLHRFQIDPAAPPGSYRLEVGIYNRADGVRLPVVVNGTIVGDRVLLQAVEVVGQ